MGNATLTSRRAAESSNAFRGERANRRHSMARSGRIGALLLALLATPSLTVAYELTLEGGHFYGPGPIVPDTPLPPGQIRNVEFNLTTLEGVAPFTKEGGVLLSNQQTHTNGNIDAGALEIGGQKSGKAFWLYAVDGGPHQGEEHYRFDEQYNMEWVVDLALDPGFAEGIVRVDGFTLTTGIVEIPLSLQSQIGMPAGYDKAGSLESGTAVVGRVGDFDQDGFLDGIIVASANVPFQADLLPGAPVGNVRGFTSDIPIEPLFAMELTLHGIANMRPLVEGNLSGGRIAKLTAWLKEIDERIVTARTNYERAFVSIEPSKRGFLRQVGWRLESIRQMNYIPLAFLTTYDYPAGNASGSIIDATGHVFDKASALAQMLEQHRKEEPKP